MAAWIVALAAASGVLIAANGCGSPVPLAVESPPCLEVTPAVLDAGTRDLAPFQVEFELTNSGGSPLRIERFEASCTCARPTFTSNVIRPGGKQRVGITVKPRQLGASEATLMIVTNDPSRSQVQLAVKWNVLADLAVDPPAIDFGTVRPGARVSRSIRVVSPSRSLESVTDVRALSPHGLLKADSSWISNTERHIDVSLSAGTGRGSFGGCIVIPVESTPAKSIQCPVRWSVEDVLDAQPRMLLLLRDRSAATLSGTIVVRSYTDGIPVIRHVRIGLSHGGPIFRVETIGSTAVLTMTLDDRAVDRPINNACIDFEAQVGDEVRGFRIPVFSCVH